MKKLIIFGSLMLSSVLLAQNEAKQLTPKWEKGLVSEYMGSYSYIGHDDNENDIRTQQRFNLNFEVVQDEKEQYIIRSLVPNFVLLEVLELSNNGKADFSVFKEVNIYYSYNKSTGAINLLNWENLKEIYTESKAEMSKYAQHYPQKLMKLDGMFIVLDAKFDNQKTVTKLYTEQINWFTSFFKKNFSENKSFTTSTGIINPFFNDENLKVSAKNTVNEINKEDKSFSYTKTFTIKDSYYKYKLEEYLKTKENKKLISEKEKQQLSKLGPTSYSPNFVENHTINYETTLPISFKIDYILEETSTNKAVKTYKKSITLIQKK